MVDLVALSLFRIGSIPLWLHEKFFLEISKEKEGKGDDDEEKEEKNTHEKHHYLCDSNCYKSIKSAFFKYSLICTILYSHNGKRFSIAYTDDHCKRKMSEMKEKKFRKNAANKKIDEYV